MQIVIQRVKNASVKIENDITGKINTGMLILLGIDKNDTKKQADFLVQKCLNLRIFNDNNKKMNLSLLDINGEILVVSQFTLLADCKKGNRPSYNNAANPKKGKLLYDYFVEKIKTSIPNVQTGIFGAMMDVSLVNDGPVTILLDK